MFKRSGENLVEVAGRVRVEKGPRRRQEIATAEILDDKITAGHYQEGKPDAAGKTIKLGESMDFIDWRGRKASPCWYVYVLKGIDEVVMTSGPQAGQKLGQARWVPAETPAFDSEDAALSYAVELLGISPAAIGPSMVYLNDVVLDSGLDILDTAADRFDICSQEPATYTEATSTYTLGNKDHGASGTAFGAPQDGDTSGRKVASTAVTDGSVTGTGTASHWAASEVGNTRLLAANSLSSSQAVTSGNTFALPSFDIEIPDPA